MASQGNIRYARIYQKVETDLKNLMDEFNAIDNFLSKIKSDISDQRMYCLNKISDIRRELNGHLDNLEQKIIKDVSNKHEHLNSMIEFTTKETDDNKTNIQDMLNDLKSLKRNDSEYDLSIITVKQTAVNAISHSLSKLREGNSLSHPTIALDINPVFKSFGKPINSFGTVSVQYKASVMSFSRPTLSFPIQTFAESQIVMSLCNAVLRYERYVSLKKVNTFKYPSGMNITGCVQLPNGKCLFVDRDKKFLVLNKSGNFEDNVLLASHRSPYDVCHIQDNTIAVSIPEDNAVVYIDIISGKTINSFIFKKKCYGVACDGKFLVIGFPRKDNGVFADLEGNQIRSLKIRGERFAFSDNAIYSVNENDDEVLCYDLFGKQTWMYPDKVRMPVGIAVDKNKNVYVFSKFNNAIYSISPNGLNSRILVDQEEDDLKDFSCMCMSPDSKRLLVCCSSNHAILYNVERQRAC